MQKWNRQKQRHLSGHRDENRQERHGQKTGERAPPSHSPAPLAQRHPFSIADHRNQKKLI